MAEIRPQIDDRLHLELKLICRQKGLQIGRLYERLLDNAIRQFIAENTEQD